MLLAITGMLLYSCTGSAPIDYSTWSSYAGTKDGNRYSSIDQINIGNVSALQEAWVFKTGDRDTANRSEMQCNPIIINGTLYVTSAKLKLYALDAATGKQKWVFDPSTTDEKIGFGINRGVMYWQDEKGKDKRILYGVASRLYAVNADDGQPVKNFGTKGSIALKEGLDIPDTQDGSLLLKTPGVIYKDLVILGMSLSEGADALPGHIRAFDVRSGRRRWIFHTIPQPGEFGYETWEDKDSWKNIGGANNWTGMSLDEKAGIVYVPTGSASPDFYGGTRKGSNFFANSIIALDAATGKYIWHYQVVHHDLWDRDLPANPNLVTIKRNGQKVDALAQITKQGYIYLLDRTNGKPIFPIPEVPVPQEALPGEKPWPTQPVPALPEPFSRQRFAPEDVSDLTPETHKELMERYVQIKNRVHYSPPAKEGGWMFPDFGGGGEWGGAAVDMESKILYVNSNEVPSTQVMIDAPLNDDPGRAVYNKHCISCHGPELKGSGSEYPSLLNLKKKYTMPRLSQVLQQGRNRMPSFKYVPEVDRNALMAFLLETESGSKSVKNPENDAKSKEDQIPYVMTGYNRFVDKDGYPGIKPPWGTLNAVNLNSGKLLWKVPLGEYAELIKRGMKPTGTRNYGGPVVTKGGLVFIAATLDEKIRAFDKNSGKLLWEARLPAAGYATPATYMIDGKQYLVIACGGGKLGTKSGDSYVAFALPEK
ncbi:MAG: PQQ-binding-like beta-propeller repeat protein [Pedobacter sp.]|jgi:quinoprotein glucose dehydrogenase